MQVAEAEEKTAGGLLLTEATKEKPSIGTVRVIASSALFFIFYFYPRHCLNTCNRIVLR